MKLYTQQFDAAVGQFKQVSFDMDIQYRSAVDAISSLPTSGNVSGDLRICLDTDHLFAYIDGQWVDQGVMDVSDLLRERLMQELS